MKDLTPTDAATCTSLFKAKWADAVRYFLARLPAFVPHEPDDLATEVILKLTNYYRRYAGQDPSDPGLDSRVRDRIIYRQLLESGDIAAIRKHALSHGYFKTVLENRIRDEIRRVRARENATAEATRDDVVKQGDETDVRSHDDQERNLVFRDLYAKIKQAFPEHAQFFTLFELVHRDGWTGEEIKQRFGEKAYRKMYRDGKNIIKALRDEWPDIYAACREWVQNNGRKE